MDIIRCIKKLYPDWKGVVWENSYEGIKPNATETRMPTLKQLQDVWPIVEQEILAEVQIKKSGKEAKDKAIAEILPNLESLQTKITDSKNLDDLKKNVTDLAKIIYMTVKGEV